MARNLVLAQATAAATRTAFARNNAAMSSNPSPIVGIILAALLSPAALAAEGPATLATDRLRFMIWPDNGRWQVQDARGGVVWHSNPMQQRFGQATVSINGKQTTADLIRCEIARDGQSVTAAFRPVADSPHVLRVKTTVIADGAGLAFSYDASPGLKVENLRLLDEAMSVTADEKGFVTVPVRMGLLIPADSNLSFNHTFDTYAYEGCHMAMLGVVKNGAAALVTWTDPYVAAQVRSTLPAAGGSPDQQTLSVSLSLRKSARSCEIHFLGKGDHVAIANAYRRIAQDRGWLVTWDQKLKQNPDRSRLFGAINFKLWSALDRRMNDDSTREQRITINWTFSEAAQVAEHLKNDLKLDKVHFLMGGWIHRGYDNQHPDILPAAPECGGNEKFAECAARVRKLGYLFGLHDNYQDMYRDAPSFSLDYIQKHPDGKPVVGGAWAGGKPYITCSQKALELAKRPQNLEAVRKLTQADTYFIDTTYAAGLQECFDPNHPLARADDMKWKQALSDYARQVFGTFGSECGREWAIPHSDYFEGMTGVSGSYYHDAGLTKKLGATVVPLFEVVYRDCIAMYGKYGYDINNSAEYVLHHISIGRTLNHHNIPRHLYWKEASADALPLQPSIAELKQAGPRSMQITYLWDVRKTPTDDYSVFIHFTDAAGKILFQGDYRPSTPTSRWEVGQVRHGPFTVSIPEGLAGTFDIRVGLWKPGADRMNLLGRSDRERRIMVGKVRLAGDKIEFIGQPALPAGDAADSAMYVRADNGWAAGMHPVDRFVKNTYEILSPLNEITSSMRMTGHEFLTPDRLVRRTTFGQGPSAVIVTANGAARDFACRSASGGEVVLPPYGFIVESPQFTAFCARRWNGVDYGTPTLFAIRDTGQPNQVRIYHGFGDPRIRLGSADYQVEKEAVVAVRAQ